MALLVKVRNTFGHRWMPFFLPVLASLLYVLMAVLVVPDSLSGQSKNHADGNTDKTESPAASAGKSDVAAARAARRRPGVGIRAPIPAGAAEASGMPQLVPPAPHAAPPPAAPDGND